LGQSIASLFIAPIDVSCSELPQQNKQLNMRIATNVSDYTVWEFHVPSAWSTLLRMKLMLFVLRNTIRPFVKPKN
jgi:hypothetical protein